MAGSNAPPVGPLAVAGALVAAGAGLRFASGYFWVHQVALRLLATATGALALAALVRLAERRLAAAAGPAALRASGVLALATVLLAAFTFEPAAANRAKNQAYLESLARQVHAYRARHGRLPEQLDEALRESGTRLPHRGDADGGPLVYVPLDEDSFYLRSKGRSRVLVVSTRGVIRAVARPPGGGADRFRSGGRRPQ